jgi:hypothetical protein
VHAMSKNGVERNLSKRFIITHNDYHVYAVNALAVRDKTQSDEEFGNFATHDEFPRLIPKDEIWIVDKSIDKEGVFFIADALARLKEKSKGASEDRAYTAGLNVERALREKLNQVKFRGGRPHRRVPGAIYFEHYSTLPDPRFPIEVWLVDGNLVRSYYKTDYIEGGHGYVYRWIPHDEIWIEHDVHSAEIPFLVIHEYLELRLMRDEKIDYDRAHAICARLEYQVRERHGITPLLCSGKRKVTKADLRKLTSPDVFSYVSKRCLRRRGRSHVG